MAKKNNKQTLQAPNYVAMLFAVIILVMFFIFINTELTMYMDIVTKRNSVADSVRTGSLDLEAIQRGYEECASDMDALKVKSQLGNVLADLDQSRMGQVGNWLLTNFLRLSALYMVYFILSELWKQVKIIWFNLQRWWAEHDERAEGNSHEAE